MSRIPRHEWASQLSEFSKRNAGRSTILEIRQPELGLREEEAGYPLQGVSFDEAANCISVFVGGETPVSPRVSHISKNPRRVEIVHRPDGQDEALHIEDRGRSMLLALI
jgi:hypothetical protein